MQWRDLKHGEASTERDTAPAKMLWSEVAVEAAAEWTELPPAVVTRPSADNAEMRTILGVTDAADFATIRSAYRALALRHHPDRLPAAERESAEEMLKHLNAAYNVLRLQAETRVAEARQGTA